MSETRRARRSRRDEPSLEIAPAPKAVAAELEKQRLEAALAASPKCARTEPAECGHELAYHDPCSRCSCPGFVEPATAQR